MSASSSELDAATTPSLFRNTNYLWLWAGGAISSLGDYFTLIAMPWLVLSISHDAAALGIVMALESLPRAAFMLFSGSASDRFTARSVLLVSRFFFMLALLALALMLLAGRVQLFHLYGFAIVFGLLTAFALPANRALLPQVVQRSQIQKGNSTLMGSQQLIQLFAPVLAGLLIWSMPTVAGPGGAGADLRHIAYAFLFNAAAIAVALVLLLQIRVASLPGMPGAVKVRLTEGFRYLKHDYGMRIATVYMGCIGFFAIGPLLTVIPQLADQRLHDGALSYGMLYAANGLGSMLGFALGGMLPKPSARRLGTVMLSADLVAGLSIGWLGCADTFATAAPALAMVGVAASYGGVLGLSWIQERVPPSLMGRVLGIVMFAVLGLTPISMTAAGLLAAHYSLALLLTASGAAIGAVALLGLVTPAIHRFGAHPVPASYQRA
ncbi:MAG: MFS transporter [Pseudomonadota bacterium]|nr:MFS transporter [Pseudomonadota bacterium]